jgi:hypothetical protein
MFRDEGWATRPKNCADRKPEESGASLMLCCACIFILHMYIRLVDGLREMFVTSLLAQNMKPAFRRASLIFFAT